MGLQKHIYAPQSLVFITSVTAIMTKSSAEKQNINYLKAVAIIMVVFYHAICDILCTPNANDLVAAEVKAVMENVHVPLFFLIAGYLCHKQNVISFYRKKVQRILIPFLFMSCLKLLFNNLISSTHIHGSDITYQLFDAFACGKLYWFCYAILIIYMVAPLFWNDKTRIWLMLIITLTANFVLGIANVELTYVLQIRNAIYQLPFFLTGMLLSQCKFKSQLIATKLLLLTGSLIVAIVTICMKFLLDIDNYLVNFVMGLSIMYILYNLAVSIRSNAIDKLLTLPARYSLQIMLFDSFYRIVLISILSKFMNKEIWMVIIVSIMVLLFSCVSCEVIAKIPGVRTLMGVKQCFS